MTTGFSDETFDFAQGSVFGFRSWCLSRSIWSPTMYHWTTTPVLAGHYAARWTSPEMTAECDENAVLHAWSSEEIPHPACTCGIYAYWTPTCCVGCPVSGVVEGSGRTIVGTKGFRCQYARIKALCLDAALWEDIPDLEGRDHFSRTNENLPVVSAIASSFGVAFYDSKAAMLADFPLTTEYLTEARSDSTEARSDSTEELCSSTEELK